MDTVEALTGVTIDKFAELNLVGFYELANAFGGVEACINKWPGGGGVSPGGTCPTPSSSTPSRARTRAQASPGERACRT